GAIIAYIVTALRKGPDALKFTGRSIWVVLRDVISAALMGAAVTIVSSRLADTQFPVKVSVNDVWGAMTIGFVSYFAGNNLIDRLVRTVNKPPPSTPPEQSSSVPTTANPTPSTGATAVALESSGAQSSPGESVRT